MEDDKKKKKNKKKKNKQNKHAVDISSGVGDSAKKDLIHASTQDHQTHCSDITQVQNEVLKIDAVLDLDARLSNGVEGVALEESVETSQVESDPLQEQQAALEETDIGLQNDQGADIQKQLRTFLEETSTELQNDNSTHLPKEVFLEGTSLSLQNDIGAHIQKETSLEETIIGFRNNNNAHIEKEASVDDTSLGLLNDNSGPIQNEASLKGTIMGSPHDHDVDIQKKDSWDEKIKRLQEENEIHLHKEASLELKLLQLEKEKDSWIHKQASLESKLLEVEKENDSWLHKQARFEDEFNHLVEKTESLSSKEVSLEEKVKQLERESGLWSEKENSTNETISNLNGNISRLQTQVMELEESRNYLLHENQQLGDSISGLQLQIQNLEERVTSAVSSSATRMANDLYIKPDPQRAVNNELPDSASESSLEISKQLGNADSTFKYIETTPAFTDRIDTSKDILYQDERNTAEDLMEKGAAHVVNSLPKSSNMTIPSFEDVAFRSEGEDKRNINAKDNNKISIMPYMNGTSEIVQIPWDENHVVGPTLQPQLNEKDTDIPLTDSPIIGAPFRMISFFARYVSGSDLVNKS